MLKTTKGNLLTASETAKRLGISRQTLCRWDLKKIRLGRKTYYEEKMVEQLLQEGI